MHRHSTIRQRPPIRFRPQLKLARPSLAIANPKTSSHSTSLIQSTSTLAHRGTKSLARSSSIAIRAGRNRLVGEILPDFAVEVGSIQHLAGISIGAGGDLLRYPVVEQIDGVGGDDEGAARSGLWRWSRLRRRKSFNGRQRFLEAATCRGSCLLRCKVIGRSFLENYVGGGVLSLVPGQITRPSLRRKEAGRFDSSFVIK